MDNTQLITSAPFIPVSDIDDHQIVCIGASAGGMEAIHELFDNMPQNTGFSFIVIQHLSSDHKSLMAELLSKHTTMNVVEAKDKTPVTPNSVYVIPNNRNITIRNKELLLTGREEGRTPNMAIDIFLHSLARDAGEKSIAVILSGTGTDGTKGIAEIKKAGGLVFVQDPSTAKFDGMPHSAIASGKMDFILSPESIAEELLMRYKVPPPNVIVDSLPEEDEPLLLEIFNTIHSKTSCDFKHYKRPTVIRRLTRRMAFLNRKDLGDYLRLLREDSDEAGLLGKELLVGVTRFFRDKDAFEELRLKVIPEIVHSKSSTETIKVWVAACSTGEEVYSIAILIREHLNRAKTDLDVKMFASDINRESIDFASKGCYSDSIVNDVPKEILDKYFIREGRKYRVVPQLRKMIVFSHHDLAKDPPFGRLDLISCRNMLIYIAPPLQRRIMGVFHFSLNVGGYLFLGPSEHIGELKDSVIEISKKWKIYKNSKPAKSIGLDTVSYTDSITKKFSPSSLVVSKEFSRKGIVETILNKVLDECSLAGAMVDSNCNIIETFGNYTKYLHLPEKKFDHNLLRMLPARTSIVVGSNFRKAITSNEKHVIKNIKISRQHDSVTITIKPFEDNFNNRSALILFNESKEREELKNVKDLSRNNGKIVDEEVTPDFHDFLTLQSELRETREILQKAVEDSETTNEELQSSNEELISSNEELQSANEELQSLNEELHTVNAENQLRIREISELNDDLNNYFRSSEIGQVFLDKNLIIRKFTSSATTLINLIETDIGRPITHISHNLPYSGLANDINHVLHYAEAIEKIIEIDNKAWYQMKILPYLREEKSIDGVVLIFIDITDAKTAELAVERVNRELKKLNEHLLQSNRELEQFAYITSHDLQEPLRKIQTFADLTAQNLNDVSISTRYLEKISSAAVRMSLLIKDVLSYSRLTFSNEELGNVDLNEVLKSALDDFELMIEQKKARISVSKLPPVRGIPLQLHQLFSNLLSNSLKFCETDPAITVNAEIINKEQRSRIPELSDQYDYVRVTFADNGIGFEQQYAGKIFTIFQRLNHRETYAGTGIGLALCKRIIENHTGAIFAKSALNCGATFEIYLPAARS
jgi:two-component system, chemotaxis family, CheB/CheR fusion protein